MDSRRPDVGALTWHLRVARWQGWPPRPMTRSCSRRSLSGRVTRVRCVAWRGGGDAAAGVRGLSARGPACRPLTPPRASRRARPRAPARQDVRPNFRRGGGRVSCGGPGQPRSLRCAWAPRGACGGIPVAPLVPSRPAPRLASRSRRCLQSRSPHVAHLRGVGVCAAAVRRLPAHANHCAPHARATWAIWTRGRHPGCRHELRPPDALARSLPVQKRPPRPVWSLSLARLQRTPT